MALELYVKFLCNVGVIWLEICTSALINILQHFYWALNYFQVMSFMNTLAGAISGSASGSW